MDNLLQETITALEENGKTPADVMWVGTREADESMYFYGEHKPSAGSWSDFEKLADFTYDSGFGGQEIYQTLVVVGENWWLERHEYDGSEWWEYKRLPIKPTGANPLSEILPKVRDEY